MAQVNDLSRSLTAFDSISTLVAVDLGGGRRDEQGEMGGERRCSEADKTIILRVEASSFPNQVGAEQIRTITSLMEGELMYQDTVLSGGQNYVTMKRVAH